MPWPGRGGSSTELVMAAERPPRIQLFQRDFAMKAFSNLLLLGCVLISANAFAADATLNQSLDKLELIPGDHIAMIGNTLPDRFQHSGWLETFIYSKRSEERRVGKECSL